MKNTKKDLVRILCDVNWNSGFYVGLGVGVLVTGLAILVINNLNAL